MNSNGNSVYKKITKIQLKTIQYAFLTLYMVGDSPKWQFTTTSVILLHNDGEKMPAKMNPFIHIFKLIEV